MWALALGVACKDDAPVTDDTEVPDVDRDGDSLSDAEEAALGTDPLLADSDGDGCDDGLEVSEGLDPLDATQHCFQFRPVKLYFSPYAGYDGASLVDYFNANTRPEEDEAIAPRLEVSLVTETYLSTLDDRERCRWYGALLPAGEGWEPTAVDGLWLAFPARMELVYVDDAPQSDCFGFDERDWPGGDPTQVLESLELVVGWGPMGSGFEAELRASVELAGLDWEADWASSVFSSFVGLSGAAPAETGYAFAYALDEQMRLMTDEQGAPVRYSDLSAVPVPAYLGGSDFRGVDAAALLP